MPGNFASFIMRFFFANIIFLLLSFLVTCTQIRTICKLLAIYYYYFYYYYYKISLHKFCCCQLVLCVLHSYIVGKAKKEIMKFSRRIKDIILYKHIINLLFIQQLRLQKPLLVYIFLTKLIIIIIIQTTFLLNKFLYQYHFIV